MTSRRNRIVEHRIVKGRDLLSTSTHFGSLFSGIGGLDIAVQASGWEPVWQVENDAFCRQVLEHHWPDVRRYEDIREIDWQDVERVELICGGFPCQPFSVAGQNRGVDDERNMWPETYRAVRELGPRYVFLENVPGLLAHEYFGTILGDLAEGGYDAVWDTFTAAEVGASHRRERLFILAYSTRERLEGWSDGRARVSAQGGGLLPSRPSEPLAYSTIDIRRALGDDGREPSDGASDRDVADTNGRSSSPQNDEICTRGNAALNGTRSLADTWRERHIPLHGSRVQATQSRLTDYRFPPGPDDRDTWARVLAEVPALEPAVCRVATRVPDRTHRLKALGNAVVPTQGEYALRTLWQRMMA